jgi:hypothetical protein
MSFPLSKYHLRIHFQILVLRLGDTPEEDELMPWDGHNHEVYEDEE